MVQEALNLLTAQPEEEWVTDPSRLSFNEFLERRAFGPTDEEGLREVINRELACQIVIYDARTQENEYRNGEDSKYGSWIKAIEAGRNYLDGKDEPITKFVRKNRSRLTHWQQVAYAWCLANPSSSVVVETRPKRKTYKVHKRGEYVEIGLYSGCGAEKHWITNDGKVRILVNED